MTKEDKKNAYLYCKFRDEQFALYDEYTKTPRYDDEDTAGCECPFLCKGGHDADGDMPKNLSVKTNRECNHQSLLENQYVTIAEIPENRRNKIVQMTDAGRTYCEKVVRHITWAEDTAMSMFTPEEQRRLIDLSRTFSEEFNHAGEPGDGGIIMEF